MANLGVTFWILTFFIALHGLVYAKFFLKKLCNIKQSCTEKDFTPVLTSILIRFYMLAFFEITLCCLINYTGLDFSESGKQRYSSIISLVLGLLSIAFCVFICIMPILKEAQSFKLDQVYFDTVFHGLVTENTSRSVMYLGLFLARRLVFSLVAVLSNGF